MRVPIRKSEEKRLKINPDYQLTPEKYQELAKKLKYLKEISHPREAAEVRRLAEMGDFSENAGYQLAKSRLRGINQRIIDLKNLLSRAEIIEPDKNISTIKIGHVITLESKNGQKKYRLLGSTETDPKSGIISHSSPLGSSLLGKKVGDEIKISLGDRHIEYRIIKIEI